MSQFKRFLLRVLRADLEESPLPWRVDISDANDLPTPLRELVERHGVLLQGSSALVVGPH